MTFKYFEHSNSNDWPNKSNFKWTEIHPAKWQVQVKDFETALEYLKEDEWWVNDCDGGNTLHYYVGISDGNEVKYYYVEHDFSAWYGEEGFEVHNSFELKEISKEIAHIPDDRDWLDIGEYNYKLKKWPPNG